VGSLLVFAKLVAQMSILMYIKPKLFSGDKIFKFQAVLIVCKENLISSVILTFLSFLYRRGINLLIYEILQYYHGIC